MKKILLIEDNPGDRDLIKEALKEDSETIHLDTLENGVEAIDFLKNRGKYSAANRPDIIILDLNLPRKDGREVLSEIKTDDGLRTIPVIILTTSKADQDIKTSYRLHANSYFLKPNTYGEFAELVEKIKKYWLNLVILSPQ